MQKPYVIIGKPITSEDFKKLKNDNKIHSVVNLNNNNQIKPEEIKPEEIKPEEIKPEEIKKKNKNLQEIPSCIKSRYKKKRLKRL